MVDTNVFVSALITPGGRVRAVFTGLETGRYIAVYSRPLLGELLDVLERPRIQRKYRLAYTTAMIMRLFEVNGHLVTPMQRVTVCRDPKDNMILEVALAGAADIVVSGDNDLLVLHSFEDIPIVSPATFIDRLALR